MDVEVFSGVLLDLRLLSLWNSEWFIKERLRERKGGTERAARRGLINRRRERRQASLYYSLLQGNRKRYKRVWRAELEIKEKKHGEWRKDKDGKIFLYGSRCLFCPILPHWLMHAECMCVIRDEMFNISPYSVNFRARIGRVKKTWQGSYVYSYHYLQWCYYFSSSLQMNNIHT